jgi:acyl carrier protein
VGNEQQAVPALEEIQNTIRQFIIANFLFGSDSSDLKNNTSFLESGTIDSTGILELIQFVEATFGIHVDDTEMMPEYLDSLDNIARFIARKTAR